jgi:hypothetical protein
MFSKYISPYESHLHQGVIESHAGKCGEEESQGFPRRFDNNIAIVMYVQLSQW